MSNNNKYLKIQVKDIDLENIEEEEERYLAVLKIAKDHELPVKSHSDFADCYKAVFPERPIHQSTVSIKFKEFNIEKNEDKEYVQIKKTEDKTIALRYIFSTNCRSVSKINCAKLSGNKQSDDETKDEVKSKDKIMPFFKINTYSGYEQVVCQAIEDCDIPYYALIPCFNAVMVVCSRLENARAIRKLVKEGLSYEFETNE